MAKMTKSKARTASTRVTRKPDATAGKRLPKPKTAWELLERVCEAIKARPLSYYQRMWSGKAEWCLPEELAAKNECGTVFCRAGWLVALNDGHKNIDVLSDEVTARGRTVGIWKRADELLGIDDGDDAKRDVDALFHENAVTGEAGSEAYVSEGVRGIRVFMRKHAARLKARSLRGL